MRLAVTTAGLQGPANKKRGHRRSTWAGALASTSPDFTLDCVHFGSCSGCTLATNLDQPPALADAAAFFRERWPGQLVLNTGDVHGWRTRAKLAVRPGADGDIAIGLFETGSHRVVSIPHCRAHHPAINACVEMVRAACVDLHIEPFWEPPPVFRAAGRMRRPPVALRPQGELRYLQLAVVPPETGAAADAGPAVQLTLVWHSPGDGGVPPRAVALASRLWGIGAPLGAPAHLHSVWLSSHDGASANAVLGSQWTCLHGPPTVWDWPAGPTGPAVCYGPASFAQANAGAYRRLLAALVRVCPPGLAVVEAYAGAGGMGLTLLMAGRAASLTCVEVNPAAVGPFEASRARLPDGLRGRVHPLVVASAGDDPSRWLAGAEVIVVDPPRRGCDAALLAALAAPSTFPRRLLYISCGVDALKRDCDALLAADTGWRIDHVEAFAFFPGTDTLETLAVFRQEK